MCVEFVCVYCVCVVSVCVVCSVFVCVCVWCGCVWVCVKCGGKCTLPCLYLRTLIKSRTLHESR